MTRSSALFLRYFTGKDLFLGEWYFYGTSFSEEWRVGEHRPQQCSDRPRVQVNPSSLPSIHYPYRYYEWRSSSLVQSGTRPCCPYQIFALFPGSAVFLHYFCNSDELTDSKPGVHSLTFIWVEYVCKLIKWSRGDYVLM